MKARTALIVGAGIGGLAAGVSLRRAGWQVRIFERAAEPRALGFALNLAPNAVQALRELGLAHQLMAEGAAIEKVEVRRADGFVLKRFNVAADLAHTVSLMVLRPALHGVLLDAIPRDALSFGSTATSFDAGEAGVTLTLKDGRTNVGDILIGADGVGSAIRRALHPQEGPPRRSGYYGVRGVAFGVAQHLGNLSVIGYFGHGIEAATVRASKALRPDSRDRGDARPDAVYWYVSVLAEDVARMPRVPEAALAYYATLLDEGFGAIVRATRVADLRVDELFDREPIDGWGSGRATLLGDAAHPMLPHTGQGAAQALEDAVALGLALRTGSDIVASLRRYERVRSRRTRAIVKRGRRIARVTTTKNPIVKAVRAAAIRLLPARAAAAGFLLARGIDPHSELRS